MAYPIILILIELVLFFTNVHFGTYLIGWDNVMPEFNLALNLKRAFFSVWQDYRGLGYLDSMAHSANLVHTISIAFLSLLLPQSLVRYVFIHITHLAGGIGFYVLAHKLTKRSLPSFLGALFYMFNLGVIQMYFAPLEVFVLHFAALPFLSLFTLQALHKPSPKNLFLLFLGAFLFSPTGFVPTVFLVFIILFFFLLLFYFFKTRNLKTVLLVATIVFAANAFWLIPWLYGAPRSANIIQNTRINQFSSEEIFYRNKANGDLFDIAKLKGFMLDTKEYDLLLDKGDYFMSVWRDHQNNPLVIILFIGFLAIAILGMIETLKNRKVFYYPFLATLFVAFFFLANDTPILEQLNGLLRMLSPTIGEAFRFPFTKFIILYAFCLSLFAVHQCLRGNFLGYRN
jgi:hypothetical protein